MENYDALFQQQTEQTEQPFDRDTWAQQKREQRQELYDLIEEMSEKTLADPSALSDYLNMQARLGKTSVANTLLVVAQKPDATFIANYDDWQKRGRSVKRGEKGTLVLEAMKAVQGDTGHAQLKMVSDVYSHILDEDRRLNADKFEKVFYQHQTPAEETDEPENVQPAAASNDVAKVLELLNKSPELTSQLLQLLGGMGTQGTVCAASAN